jgi:hypothetical protein
MFGAMLSGMKPLIPVLVGSAAITAAITSAFAQAHGAFAGQTAIRHYAPGYGVAAALLLAAGVIALRRESAATESAVRVTAGSEPVIKKDEPTLKFVLDMVGTQPLSSPLCDWRFLVQNCGSRTARYVQLGRIRSEIGAYEIEFKTIPALVAGEKATAFYEVYARRHDEKYGKNKAALWDFATDHAGERGNTFIWYDIPLQYHEADDSIRDAGILSVCFDLEKQILKTEGVEFWNEKKKYDRSLQ